MVINTPKITGGCQCGAVRFAVSGDLGRASLCHCRMCQKAFGAFFGPLVSTANLHWTRGAPKYFQSSNQARRGFCEKCGTPLTFESDRGPPDIAIGALDDPVIAKPVIQFECAGRLPWLDELTDLPGPDAAEQKATQEYHATLISFQHPDHDTENWQS
jgi:hypothetical protein